MRRESYLAGVAIAGEVADIEAEGVTGEMFEDAAARRVFEVAQKCAREGHAFDEARAGEVLADMAQALPPSVIVQEMVDAFTSKTTLKDYCAEVRGAWKRRAKAEAYSALAEAERAEKPEDTAYWQKRLEEVEAKAGEAGGAFPRLTLIRNTDFVARNTPLPPPVVDGLFSRGELSLFVAPSKKGKTAFSLQMALCVSAGKPFLDFRTRRGRVIYMNTEVGEASWEERNRRARKALGIEGDEDRELWQVNTRGLVDSRGNPLTLQSAIPALRYAMKENGLDGVDLIIIDPWYALATGIDENKAGEVAGVMLGYQRLGEELGTAIWIVHHFAKGDAKGKAAMDRGSGSGAFQRAVDNNFTLTPTKDGGVVLEGSRRNGPGLSPLELSYEFPLWRVVGFTEPVEGQETRRGRPPTLDTDAIVAAFKTPDEALTVKEFKKRTEAVYSTAWRHLKEATERGVLCVDGNEYRLAKQYAALMQRGIDEDERADAL